MAEKVLLIGTIYMFCRGTGVENPNWPFLIVGIVLGMLFISIEDKKEKSE